MTIWFGFFLLAGFAFSAAAIQGQRKLKASLPLIVAIGVVPLVAVGMLIVARYPSDVGFRMSMFFVLVAAVGGCAACALTVARLVKASSVPDPFVETAIGAAAFIGGALLATLIVWFIIASAMPGIT